MRVIYISSVFALMVLATACEFPKKQKEIELNDNYEVFVAPATPEHKRNSESAIIELKDGSLLLGWTEFYDGQWHDDSPARISGKISVDGGRAWEGKYTLVENDGEKNVMEVNFLRLLSGDIALFYLQQNKTSCPVMMRTSSDEGKTWSNVKQISEGGLTNGRCIRLSTGRILLESYNFCIISDDDGKSWHDSQKIIFPVGYCAETACIELKDGKVMMLLRTNLGCQYKSISSDGGETWSQPVPTPLIGTDAPVSLSRITKTGDILAIWNYNWKYTGNGKLSPVEEEALWHKTTGDRRRIPLTSAISKDEGETWEHFRNLEEIPGEGWCYPAVTWVENRALVTYFSSFCAFDFEGENYLTLKLRSLPAEWFYQ
ncbi:MAG: sialidase family protein [Mangrovibacterium sp.]|nr:sialidase family protein [Mangrovibacterium sp.]